MAANGPQIVITLDLNTQQLSFDGPIDNWVLCHDLLEGAKDVIKQYHIAKMQERSKGIIAAPANALNNLPKQPIIRE